MMRGDRRWIAVTSGAGGLALFAGSMLSRWRSISSSADQGSPDRTIDGTTPQVHWYISGMLCLLLLVEAELLARGRVQVVLRLLGAAPAAVAARLSTTLAAPFGIDPPARAHVRPGPAFLLAGAAVLECLVAICAAPRRGTAVPQARGTLSHLGSGLFTAGLAALARRRPTGGAD
jgi:hypothetical protein